MIEQNQQTNHTEGKSFFPSKFTVRLRMKSDWHVGSGVGRPGNVDSLISRDAQDLPFVPAKTLTGIWRDAAEMLAYALDEGEKSGEWTAWVNVLFGDQPSLTTKDNISTQSPKPASLSISPARLSENFRNVLEDKVKQPKDKILLSALTFIKPGIAIDESSGISMTDFLRFEEMARTGAELVADCELKSDGWTEDQRETAAALLMASAKWVERLGGKRRRGGGRCTLTIDGYDLAKSMAWLQNHKKPSQPPIVTETIDACLVSAIPERPSEWMRLEVRLTLKTPVAIVSQTLGNTSETLDFVPGTYLLPHITKVLKELGYDCRPDVAYGNLQVLPANIEILDRRGLPVPNILAHKKEGGGFNQERTIINRLKEISKDMASEESDEKPQVKNFRSGYIGEDFKTEDGKDKLPTYKTVPKTLLTHNSVSDDFMRPMESVGGVYSREAMASYDPSTQSEVTLRTELRFRKEIDEVLKRKQDDWWRKLSENGRCRIGVSIKDDYGAAELKVLGAPAPMKNPPPEDRQKSENGHTLFSVWLLSDLLLRGESLRQTTSIEALKDALQERLSEAGGSHITLKEVTWEKQSQLMTSLMDTRRIESWHKGWGLPRPSLIAIKAGSCAVFEVEQGTLDLKTLAKLEREGIGERRGEGYGQLCFNHPLLLNKINAWAPSGDASKFDKKAKNKPTGDILNGSEDEKEYAKIIEDATWREALRRAALRATNTHDKRREILGLEIEGGQSKPPMSQLGGLRAIVQRLCNEKTDLAVDWINHLEKTKNRKEKWPDQALDKVRKLIAASNRETVWTNRETVWKLMEKGNAEKKNKGKTDENAKNDDATKVDWENPPTLVRTPEEMRRYFWAEAVRLLVDACIRAHKRDLEKAEREKRKKEGK